MHLYLFFNSQNLHTAGFIVSVQLRVQKMDGHGHEARTLRERYHTKFSEGSEAEAGMDAASRKISEMHTSKNDMKQKVIRV